METTADIFSDVFNALANHPGVSAAELQALRVLTRTLDALGPAGQQAILTVPDAVWGLAFNGKADAVWNVIAALDPAGQQAILAAQNAVWGLARNGEADAVWSVIVALDPAAQQAILAAPNAVWALADNGKADAVNQLRDAIGMRGAASSQQTKNVGVSGAPLPRP